MAPTNIVPLDTGTASLSTDSGNLRGALLMLAGFFLFSAADVLAKLLSEDLHPVQIVWSRQLGLVAVILAMVALKGPRLLATSRPGLQMLRGAVMVISATSFVFAISHVPLADAVAVTFLAPFLVTVFGALLLREYVGARRWAAVAVGFAGTMIVIRPGLGVFHPAIFFVVLAAAAFAARQLLSRVLSGSESTTATVAYTALTSTVLLTLPLPFVWVMPTGEQLALMLGMTVLAGFAEYLIIRALDIAQAVVVSPMQYSLMIWGTLWGYVVYNDLPDGWTWVGASVIVASGLYTLHREALAMRRRRRAANALSG